MNEQIDCGQRNHHKWPVPRKILGVEELETLPLGTVPKKSHHRLPGDERCEKRKSSTMLIEKKSKSQCQSGQHQNCFKDSAGKTSPRPAGHMGFLSVQILF